MERLEQFGPLLLRVGLAYVFFWFGLHQLTQPDMWAGYVPTWLAGSASALVLFNGVFELVFAALLLLGLKVRWVAALLGLHLLGIAWTAGGAVGVRDLGLAIACLSLACTGSLSYTLEAWLDRATTQRA